MKRLLTYSLIACLLCTPLVARGQANDSKEELINLDRKLHAAIYNGNDVALLDKLLADDWYGTTTLGETQSKAELLEQIRKAKSDPGRKKPPMPEVSPSEVKVHTHGDTAIVSGVLSVKSKGEELGPSRYVNIYMMINRRWRAVSTHYC